MKVAFAVYDRFCFLDLAGPVDVLRGVPGAEVHLVAPGPGSVTTDSGLEVRPTHTIDQVPDPDVVVVPGTDRPDLAVQYEALVGWLRAVASRARWMASVCTGAALLGAAGLLDGRKATTHWSYRGPPSQTGAEVVAERYVFDGNVVTAASVSAGIDMALALLEREVGARRAQVMQLAIEYDPGPPFDTGSHDRAGHEVVREALRVLFRAGKQTARRGGDVPLAAGGTA